MTFTTTAMTEQTFTKTVQINAPAVRVWQLLTDTEQMKHWISESEMEVITDWEVGGPFIIRGRLHKVPFENRGTVLSFKPMQELSYTHLSSISRLPDVPESYTRLTFTLSPEGEATHLTLTVSNFPTDTIYHHLAFYWRVTLEYIKQMAESRIETL